jgi:hypothetical protein
MAALTTITIWKRTQVRFIPHYLIQKAKVEETSMCQRHRWLALMIYSGDRGKLIHEKTEVKNLVALSL